MFRDFEAKSKVHFLKCEIKANITLVYALVTLLNNILFHNCKYFEILPTPFSYFGLRQWSKGKILTEKQSVPGRITKRVIFHSLYKSGIN